MVAGLRGLGLPQGNSDSRSAALPKKSQICRRFARGQEIPPGLEKRSCGRFQSKTSRVAAGSPVRIGIHGLTLARRRQVSAGAELRDEAEVRQLEARPEEGQQVLVHERREERDLSQRMSSESGPRAIAEQALQKT